MWLFIIGVIVLSGLLNPWTGIFSGTYKRSEKPTPPKPTEKHRSFRLTKVD